MGNLPLVGGIGVGLVMMVLFGPRRVAKKIRAGRPRLPRLLLSFATGGFSGAASGALIHFVLNYLHRMP